MLFYAVVAGCLDVCLEMKLFFKAEIEIFEDKINMYEYYNLPILPSVKK